MVLVVFLDSILLKWLVLVEVDSGTALCQASFTSAQKFIGPCRKWADVEDQPFVFMTCQRENRKLQHFSRASDYLERKLWKLVLGA